jgi:hypothetical protein
VDNFLVVFFFNDFNDQTPKSLESNVFIDYSEDLALFECPVCKRLNKALHKQTSLFSNQSTWPSRN